MKREKRPRKGDFNIKGKGAKLETAVLQGGSLTNGGIDERSHILGAGG